MLLGLWDDGLSSERAVARQCWACKSEIADDQLICIECDSWQNWRRYTVFSAMILSLLISLLSVFGLVFPTIRSALVKEEIVLDARIQRRDTCALVAESCSRDSDSTRTEFEFWFSNLTSFPVLLSDVMQCASLGEDKIDTEDEFEFPRFKTQQRTLLLPPDQSYEDQRKIHYVYDVYNDDAPSRLPWARDIACAIQIESRPTDYFAFRIHDNDILRGSVVGLGRDYGLGDEELFVRLASEL